MARLLAEIIFVLTVIAAFFVQNSVQQNTCDPNCVLTSAQDGCAQRGPGTCDGDCKAGYTKDVLQNICVGSGVTATTTQAATTTSRPTASAAAAATTAAAAAAAATTTTMAQAGSGLSTSAQQNSGGSSTKSTGSTKASPFVPPTLSSDQLVTLAVVPPIVAGAAIIGTILFAFYVCAKKRSKKSPENADIAAVVSAAPPTRGALPVQTNHVTVGQEVPAAQYPNIQWPYGRLASSSAGGYGYSQPVVETFWR